MRALRVLQHRAEALSTRVEGELAAGIQAGAALPEVAALAARALDRAVDGAIARAPGGPPACAAGCAWCCHVNVDASLPEILAVAAHVERTFAPAARRALREALAARRAAPLDDQARWAARVPCALLGGDGRCTIYEARPLRCRAFHAASADPCRAAFEGDPHAEPAPCPTISRAAQAVEEGYDRALAAAGISPSAYRLEIGLAIALDGAGDAAPVGDPFSEASAP